MQREDVKLITLFQGMVRWWAFVNVVTNLPLHKIRF
jgi:hypothetical protein